MRRATSAESRKVESEAEPVERARVDVRSVALTILAVLATIVVLQYAKPVLIPVIIAVLISYVLGPAVESMARHGLPRYAGAAIAILLLTGGLAYGGYRLTPQVLAIVEDTPDATRSLLDRFKRGRQAASEDDGALEKVQRAATEIDKAAAAATEPTPVPQGVTRVQVVEPTFRATDYLWSGGRSVMTFFGQLTMVLFLVFFLLASGDLFKRKLVKLAGPTLTKKRITVQIMDEINSQISGFLRVQVLTSAVVAVATGIALWFFGVERYVVWGALAGIFNSVPYLGPIIVTGGLSVVTFMQFDDLARTLYVCGATLAITSLEGWLLTPALMSRAGQMNPVAIFVGLLFWSWVWGVWGTVLAVPIMMTAKAICDRVEDLRPVGELLGE